MPVSSTVAPRCAKLAASDVSGRRSASSAPGVALAIDSVPAKPSAVGCARAPTASDACGKAASNVAGSTAVASTSSVSIGAAANGVSRTRASNRASRAAPCASTSMRARRAAHSRMRVDARPVVAAGESGIAGERERRRRIEADAADDAPARESRGDFVQAMAGGVAAIAEREAGGAPLALAQRPVERGDAGMLDDDAERQAERARQFAGRLRRRRDRDVDRARAECDHVQLAARQRARVPFDDDVARDDRRRVALPAQRGDVELGEQRALRAFDDESPAGIALELAEHVGQPGLRAGEQRDERHQRERGDEDSGERPCGDAQRAPARLARRRRLRRGGAHVAQNASPTEKCTRTRCTSWPYARSRRNGPIGVRRRPPTP